MTVDLQHPRLASEDAAREAIVDLVEAAVRNQSDPEPFLALHTDDVVVVNIAGRRVLGRGQLDAAMRAALVSPLADVTTTVDIDDIRFLRGDVAIVSCTKWVHDARTDERDELPQAGVMSYLVVNGDDGWRIALAQTTPRQVRPAPAGVTHRRQPRH
jgi:uncharacterized protein (TIGR02246 family)